MQKPKGLRRRGRIWWIDITRDKQRIRISTKCTTLPGARKFFDEYLTSTEKRTAMASAARASAKTQSELLNEWAASVSQENHNPEHWINQMWKRARSGAKQRKLLFDLTKDDLRLLLSNAQGRCQVTGLPFNWERHGGRFAPFKPSIDRIDNSEGYVLHNCRIVCAAVNLAMNSWGETVFEKIAVAYLVNETARAHKITPNY